MKLIRTNDEVLVFRLNAAEKSILSDILGLYPLVPAAHHRLSKSIEGRKAEEYQRLLDDALAEERAGNRQRVKLWLTDKKRFRRTKTGFTLSVPRADADWLMQVLNDLRVGSWLLLGSPEDRVEPDDVSPKLHSVWATMELSGLFQMFVLHALEGRPLD